MTVSVTGTWRLRKRVCVTRDSPVSKKQVRIQTQAFRSKASVLSLCQMSCYGSMKLSTGTYGTTTEAHGSKLTACNLPVGDSF